MCDPVTAGVTLAAASNVAQFTQETASFKAQRALNRKNLRQTAESATIEAIDTGRAANRSLIQKSRQASIDIRDVERRAKAATGTIVSSAARSGVAGASVAAMIQDVERQQLEITTNVQRDFDLARIENRQQRRAASRRAKGIVRSAIPNPIARPSLLGAALRVGGAVAQGRIQQQQFKASVEKP